MWDKTKIFFEGVKLKIKPLVAAVAAVSALIFAGYSAGKYLEEMHCETEKLVIIEEYQTKIFDHRSECQSYMVDGLMKQNTVMELTIEQLKKIQNEK